MTDDRGLILPGKGVRPQGIMRRNQSTLRNHHITQAQIGRQLAEVDQLAFCAAQQRELSASIGALLRRYFGGRS